MEQWMHFCEQMQSLQWRKAARQLNKQSSEGIPNLLHFSWKMWGRGGREYVLLVDTVEDASKTYSKYDT